MILPKIFNVVFKIVKCPPPLPFPISYVYPVPIWQLLAHLLLFCVLWNFSILSTRRRFRRNLRYFGFQICAHTRSALFPEYASGVFPGQVWWVVWDFFPLLSAKTVISRRLFLFHHSNFLGRWVGVWVGVVLGEALGVWRGVYLNGDDSGNRMPYTYDFDLIDAFVIDFGGGSCVNYFLDVGGRQSRGWGARHLQLLWFLPRLAPNSSFIFLLLNFSPSYAWLAFEFLMQSSCTKPWRRP